MLLSAMKGEGAPPPPGQAKLSPIAIEEVIPDPAARAAEGTGKAMAVGLQDIHFDFDKYKIRQGDAAVPKETASSLRQIPAKSGSKASAMRWAQCRNVQVSEPIRSLRPNRTVGSQKKGNEICRAAIIQQIEMLYYYNS